MLADRQVGGSGNAQRGEERNHYKYEHLHDGRPNNAPILQQQ